MIPMSRSSIRVETLPLAAELRVAAGAVVPLVDAPVVEPVVDEAWEVALEAALVEAAVDDGVIADPGTLTVTPTLPHSWTLNATTSISSQPETIAAMRSRNMLWMSAAEQSLWMTGVRELIKAEFLQMHAKSVSWHPVEPILDSAGACCKYILVLVLGLSLVKWKESHTAHEGRLERSCATDNEMATAGRDGYKNWYCMIVV